jgi:asparaginyl-tRNA synthetase
MLEVEQTYVESWRDPMEILKNSICHVTRNLYSSRIADAIIHGKRSEGPEEEPGLAGKLEERWQGMMQYEWPQISYTKAISLLEQHADRFEHRPEWGLGFKSEHENFIAKHVGKGSPVFITHYPKAIKPFYMLKAASNVEETGSVVHNFDLVVPEVCEIAGGSLREHDLETLIKEMQSRKMLPEGESSQLSAEDFGNYKDYIDLRRWGYIPSGGFGLGFDRLIMYLTGIPNIREVIRYPRSFRH